MLNRLMAKRASADKDRMTEKIRILYGLLNLHAAANTILKNHIQILYDEIDAFDEANRPAIQKAGMLCQVQVLVGELDDCELKDRGLQAEIDALYVALDALEPLPADPASMIQVHWGDYA